MTETPTKKQDRSLIYYLKIKDAILNKWVYTNSQEIREKCYVTVDSSIVAVFGIETVKNNVVSTLEYISIDARPDNKKSILTPDHVNDLESIIEFRITMLGQ